MPEKFPYNLEKSQDEAEKMREKIESGKAESYVEAEKLVEKDEKKKQPSGAKDIKEKIILTPEQEIAKEDVMRSLSKGDLVFVDMYMKNLPKEILFSEEAQQVATEGFILMLSKGELWNARRIMREPHLLGKNLSSPEIQQAIKKAIKEGLIYDLSEGKIADYNIIIQEFPVAQEILSSPEIKQAAMEGFVVRLAEGDISGAFYLRDKFNLSVEFTLEDAKESFIGMLSEGNIESAMRLKGQFPSLISPQEIIDKIPVLADLMAKIMDISPEFYSQSLKSIDYIIPICKFLHDYDFLRTIKKNQFLLDAVQNNPNLGSKLFIKYFEFNKSSKENIETLFNVKNKILADNPKVDPRSLEFRQLMQEKLKEYKNNSKILEAAGENELDINEWLNYSDIKKFTLKEDENIVPFSEIISTPVNRIKETLDKYADSLKDSFKEYKSEFIEFKIPLESIEDIEAKINQMQIELEKAKSESNENKVSGIERGINGLKNKINNIKTVSLWDKLVGDISAFQQLKDDIFDTQGKLIQVENDLQEKLSGEMSSGKIIQELKEDINKIKEELRSKFYVLERRIEDFKNNLPTLIFPCLGGERTDALIQETQMNISEEFDHYKTDVSTLSGLFSEKGDKEKNKLENRTMNISVWTRNPDIDLYQGNYTNCCIRIDSEHMGGESTIADYSTDLGIQIVNILDEAKNKPITAAWLWLGKDERGNAALVVDNIESDTTYSANYPKQLTKELFNYLNNYAQAIGVKKVVLGKANNDLPTSKELGKMSNDEHKYDKIGGYNRLDGYFLEAKDKETKILWEEK